MYINGNDNRVCILGNYMYQDEPERGDGVSSISMVVFLMRCRLRLPSRIVSASSIPVLIQRLMVVSSTRSRFATCCGVKYSCSMQE
jgi:hypothetical protein